MSLWDYLVGCSHRNTSRVFTANDDPVIPVVVEGMKLMALVDTGASHTCVDMDILSDIQSESLAEVNASGSFFSPCKTSAHKTRVEIPDVGCFDLTVIASPFPQPNYQTIIGRDILNYCELKYWKNKFSLRLL